MLEDIMVRLVAVGLVLGVFAALFSLFTLRGRREQAARDEVLAAGHKVWAPVISKQPTGQSTGSDAAVQYKVQYYVLLELNVPQPNGTSVPCTIKCLPAPSWHALQPGDQVQVYQMPDNPTRIALNTIMTPRYLNANKLF